MTYKESVAIGVSLAALGGVGVGIMWMRKDSDGEATRPAPKASASPAAPVAPPEPPWKPGTYNAAFILGRDEATVTEAIGVTPSREMNGGARYRLAYKSRSLVVEYSKGVAVRIRVIHPDDEVTPTADVLAWLSMPDDMRIGKRSYEVWRPKPGFTDITEVNFAMAERKTEATMNKALEILARKEFGTKLEQVLITKMHWEADAEARGPNMQTLRITSVMCGRVTLTVFMEKFGDLVWAEGFKKIECRDPYMGGGASIGENK